MRRHFSGAISGATLSVNQSSDGDIPEKYKTVARTVHKQQQL